ncbi:MAG TPA: glycosyltransferase family 39 protein, partial [Armatimonadota bacterium]
MMHPLLALPISIVFLLVIVGFGRKLLSLMRLDASSRAETSVFGLAIGLGVTAYAVLVVGLLRQLHSYVLLGLIAAMGIVSFGEIRTMLRECVSGLRENSGSTLNWADGLIALSCAALCGLALINVLAPPTSMDWDGLSYHLSDPKLYLSHNAVYYIHFTSHSNFPFLTEMLYTIGLSIGSTGVAKFFHFSMYIGTALALYALCRRHMNPSVGKIAALLYMSTPVVFYEAGIAYADLTMGFYILLAVHAMLNWQETKAKSWLVLCSVMCGFALGTKVFTAVPIVVICSIILASSGREGRWGKGLA